MSSKIDERVVSMKINAEQFQKGVAETSSALDRLKAALNLGGAEKSLQNLDAAGRNVNMRHIADGVDDVASRFSNLQVIGIGALAMIGAKAIEIGQTIATQLGQAATRDIGAGYSDYNAKLTSVQTIMNATGQDIGVVEAHFKELDTYADKTIYNLGDMTSAFAKFTNAGLDMDTSVPAIKGIANMVALAGQDANAASIAMYNLSQSIGTGFLTTTDFRSLNLANVATKEWKDQMIQGAVAAGTLRAEADGTFSIMADGSERAATAASLFTEDLSTGWASADVLLKVLGDYGNAETEIGEKALAAAQNVKSLPMMLETLAAAAGTGWTDTFDRVLGNVTEATEFFSFLTAQIAVFTDESAKARNAQLDLWRDSGGRAAIFDTKIGAIANIFAALNSVLQPLKDAFRQVFPPKLGDTLTTISVALQRFTAGLILSEGAQKNLKTVALAVFTVLKFGFDIVMGIGKAIFFLVGLAFDLAGALFSIISPILTFVASFMPIQKGAEDATSSVSGFFDMLIGAGKFLTGWLISALRAAGELFDNFLNGAEATERVRDFRENLEKLGATIAMFWSILTRGEFTGGGFFDENSKVVENLFKIREVIVKVIDAIFAFGDAFQDAIGRAGSVWGAIGAGAAAAWGMIKPFADSIGKFFKDLMNGIDMDTALAAVNTGVLIALAVGIGKVIKKISDSMSFVGDFKKGLIDGLDGLTGVLGAMQTKLKADAMLKIAFAIGILAAGLWILSTIDPNRLVSAVTGMATAFGILLGGMAIMDKIEAEPSLKASVAMGLIAVAINILATAIVKIGSLNPEQLTAGLIGTAAAMAILVVAATAMAALDENDILKASVALNLMAAAMLVMAGVVAIFGVLPIDVLNQGIGSVALVLGGLVLAAALLQKYAPSMVLSAVGLMAMAAALNMMIVPITALGLLPVPVLAQGMIMLAVILGGLVIAAQNMSRIAPQMALAAVGMIAMAVALNMMIAPIAILGAMPLEVLAVGIAALAIVMVILVAATNAMTTAMPGAVAMIAVAAALLILSVALSVMAGIGMEGIVIAILGLVAAVLAMAIISAILTPLIPVMAGVAGVMALFALGMLALSVAMMVGVAAIALLGPALLMATGGIVVFASAAEEMLAVAGPMALFGAAMIAFGAGALIAGAGILVLGAGLILLGAGLALVGAVGLIGATALLAVVKSMMKLMEHVPGMIILAGTFTVLGAGVLVLGAGLLVLGAGAMLVAIALLLLVPLGAMVTLSFNLIIKAIERLIPKTEQIASIAASLKTLGSAIATLADNGRTAATGLNAIGASFALLAAGANTARMAMQMMAVGMAASMSVTQNTLNQGQAAFVVFVSGVLSAVNALPAGLNAAFGQSQAAAARLASVVGGTLVGGIRASYGSVYSSAVTLGYQMIAGMNQGLQNGSSSVANAASNVAQRALNAANATLGVASPSKETEKTGKWFDMGLVNGVMKNMYMVEDAGKAVGNSALHAMQQSLSDIKNAVAMDMDFTPSIRPVLDLSAIQKDTGLLNNMLTPPTLRVDTSYAQAAAISDAQNRDQEFVDAQTLEPVAPVTNVSFVQNNTSPKALSTAEIYRQTKNQISTVKGALEE